MAVVFSKLYILSEKIEKSSKPVLYFGCIFMSIYGMKTAKTSIYRKM